MVLVVRAVATATVGVRGREEREGNTTVSRVIINICRTDTLSPSFLAIRQAGFCGRIRFTLTSREVKVPSAKASFSKPKLSNPNPPSTRHSDPQSSLYGNIIVHFWKTSTWGLIRSEQPPRPGRRMRRVWRSFLWGFRCRSCSGAFSAAP